MKPEQLMEFARKAFEQAHAPYSTYQVGAALLCADGTVHTGCNVENVSYGLTNCAERTAIFSAVASGQRHFKAIAIAASATPTPYPCGACRQVLSEFCAPEFDVYIDCGETIKETTLGKLLPCTFGSGGSNG